MSNLGAFDWSSVLPAPVSAEQLVRNERRLRAGEADAIRRRLPELFASAKLPELATHIGHESLRQFVATWDPRRHGNALVIGGTGIGKSTAAAAVFLRLLKAGYANGGADWEFARGMRWCRMASLERELREHPLGRGVSATFAAAQSASLLIVDEIGWERDPKAAADLLAERYDAPGLTICTSGLSRDELTARYGAAVVRRMLTFKQRAPRIVEAWPSAEVARPKPPSDQEALARRQGEKL